MPSYGEFIRTTRKGLILRVFAVEPADVPQRVAWTRETVERASMLRFAGGPIFDRIDVMMFVDERFGPKRFPDGAGIPRRNDCGLTEAALREALSGFDSVRVHAEPGDLFCGLLNAAISRQMLEGVECSTILSTDARSCLTRETMEDVYGAMAAGACAAGVAVNDVRDSVLEGRFANAFTCWRNPQLASVGFFDLQAAMREDPRARALLDWCPETDSPGLLAIEGVEEVIPLARLVEQYGKCLAPILPRGDGILQYEEPDPVNQPELYARYRGKIRTKKARQDVFLAAAGYGPDWLKGGVMGTYRRS